MPNSNIFKVFSKILLHLDGNMAACEKDSVNIAQGYFLSLSDAVSERFEQITNNFIIQSSGERLKRVSGYSLNAI